MATAVATPILIGFAALVVDVGIMYNTRTELQRTADAAALAAAWELLDQDKLTGTADMSLEEQAARQAAVTFAALNPVQREGPVVDPNTANTMDGDVVIGYRSDPTNPNEPLNLNLPDQVNTALVSVRRDDVRNGPVPLLFARIFGLDSSNIQAQAMAIIKDGVVGFKASDDPTVNCSLLPFALHVDAWNDLRAGTYSKTGDEYYYDLDTGRVSPGADGVRELNLYPGAGSTQLTPGNFGTVDIGSTNNSAADISRQILYGVSPQDLSYFGGELRLDGGVDLWLEGDTGLSAGFKDELEAIIGQERTLPVFDTMDGNGDNARFRIVCWAGVRIVHVRLNGPMKKKEVRIQPANCVDSTAITKPGTGPSNYVYQPPYLIR